MTNTEELNLKLIRMSDRIAQLEEALTESHIAAGNLTPHPLLCWDLRAIRMIVGYNVEREEDIPRHHDDPLENFGSLTIADDGVTRFLGPSAGSEVSASKLLQCSKLINLAEDTAGEREMRGHHKMMGLKLVSSQRRLIRMRQHQKGPQLFLLLCLKWLKPGHARRSILRPTALEPSSNLSFLLRRAQQP